MSEDDIIKKAIRNEWSQIGLVLITISGLFFWNRTESRSDLRELRCETMVILREIQAEMKDFHGRLCAIEEKNKKCDPCSKN